MGRLSTTKLVQCSECPKSFYTNRNGVHTCSNACRQKRYRRLREKRQEARRAQLKLPWGE